MAKKNSLKPKTALSSLSQSRVKRLENGNLEIMITIPRETIAAEYQKALTKLAKATKLKGFRPGKAPLKMAEKQLGKEAIYQEMVKNLTTDVYLEAVKTHKLVPIVNPRVSLIRAEENKDWQIKAVTAEAPKVELGDYQQKVKKELAPEKIWVPGKDKQPAKNQEKKQDQKLQQVLAILFKSIKINIPQVLLENEVNRMLSQLIDQTSRLGMTVEQYLTSIGKNTTQIRTEYQKQAEESIKLELILSAIADQEQIKITAEEITKLSPPPKGSDEKNQPESPLQKAYVRQLLRKRKAIDILLKL